MSRAKQWELEACNDETQTPPFSVQRVRCCVPGCSDTYLRNNAPGHFKARHAAWELVPNGDKEAESTRSLREMFSRGGLKRGRDDGAAAAAPSAAALPAAAPPPAAVAKDEPPELVAASDAEEEEEVEEDDGYVVLPTDFTCPACEAPLPEALDTFSDLIQAGYNVEDALSDMGVARWRYCCRQNVVYAAGLRAAQRAAAGYAFFTRRAAAQKEALLVERTTKLDQLLGRSEEQAARDAELLSVARRSAKLLETLAAAGAAAEEKELRARTVAELAVECNMEVRDRSSLVCKACWPAALASTS